MCRHCHVSFSAIDVKPIDDRTRCCGYGCSLTPEIAEIICHSCKHDPFNCIFACKYCKTGNQYCGRHGTGCTYSCISCKEHQNGSCGYYGDEVTKNLLPSYLNCRAFCRCRHVSLGYKYCNCNVCTNDDICTIHSSCCKEGWPYIALP